MFPLEFIPFSNCLKHASAMKFLHKIDDAKFHVQFLNLIISRTTVSCLLSNLMILALFLNSYNNFRNLGQQAVGKDITRCHFLTTFLLSIYDKRVNLSPLFKHLHTSHGSLVFKLCLSLYFQRIYKTIPVQLTCCSSAIKSL